MPPDDDGRFLIITERGEREVSGVNVLERER